MQDELSEQPPREPTPGSFSSHGGGSATTTTGTPGTTSSSGRHSSLSHGARSSSYVALAHTPPPLEASLTHRPDTPLSATAPQPSYLSHTPPNEGSRSPFSMSGIHAALPGIPGTATATMPMQHQQQHSMGIVPSLGSSSTSLTMMGNPIHNPGASYSRYSSGVVTPLESIGYEASNEPSLYSGGGSYGYARIDSKLHSREDFHYMDDDPGLSSAGGLCSMNTTSPYPPPGLSRGPPNPASLMYSSESISSTTDSPINQPEAGIYEDESIFDQPPPPAPSSKPKDKSSHSKKNKLFKNYYDKSSLNQIVSTSSKTCNRCVTSLPCKLCAK